MFDKHLLLSVRFEHLGSGFFATMGLFVLLWLTVAAARSGLFRETFLMIRLVAKDLVVGKKFLLIFVIAYLLYGAQALLLNAPFMATSMLFMVLMTAVAPIIEDHYKTDSLFWFTVQV